MIRLHLLNLIKSLLRTSLPTHSRSFHAFKMQYAFGTLLTFNSLIALALASCDVSFCVSQFCPPSVGDVGWCLCKYDTGNTLYEVLLCFEQECGQAADFYPNSNVTSCCGTPC